MEFFYIMTLNNGKEIKTMTGRTNNAQYNGKSFYEYLMTFCCEQLNWEKENTTLMYYYIEENTKKQKRYWILTAEMQDEIMTQQGQLDDKEATAEEIFNSIVIEAGKSYEQNGSITVLYYRVE